MAITGFSTDLDLDLPLEDGDSLSSQGGFPVTVEACNANQAPDVEPAPTSQVEKIDPVTNLSFRTQLVETNVPRRRYPPRVLC